MPLIINDASILIDLMKIGLLEAFFELDFEMHVTDLVISEITDENAGKLNQYLCTGKLHLRSFNFDELSRIQRMNVQHPQLSIPDCSCLYLSERVSGILLTYVKA